MYYKANHVGSYLHVGFFYTEQMIKVFVDFKW